MKSPVPVTSPPNAHRGGKVVKWRDHKWALGGHEWSPGSTALGTKWLWYRSVFPRIRACLPARTVLEIAPGFGRWTTYLIGHCENFIGVELTERCARACAERFAATRAQFVLNDGRSLPVVDGSIDFVFSFDSLVHVEALEVRAYLRELARVLRPGGTAWLHHSNLAAYAINGRVPAALTRRLWRATSMSARLFRESCREAGLRCVSQEIVNFVARGTQFNRYSVASNAVPLTDCFSLVQRPLAEPDADVTRVYVNRRFVDEWRQLLVFERLYELERESVAVHRASSSSAGRAELLVRLRDGVLRRGAEWRSRMQERTQAFAFRHREPIARRLSRGWCPDCGRRLRLSSADAFCGTCGTELSLD